MRYQDDHLRMYMCLSAHFQLKTWVYYTLCNKTCNNSSQSEQGISESRDSTFQADITYYPYDKQKCGIEITSWGYTLDEVVFYHLFESINMEDFVWVTFALHVSAFNQ